MSIWLRCIFAFLNLGRNIAIYLYVNVKDVFIIYRLIYTADVHFDTKLEFLMKNVFLFFFICFALSTSFAFAQSDIVINEIMYNSLGTDVEYVELYNASLTEYNLQNWYLLDDADDHTPCKLAGTLKSGEYLVIAADVTIFKQKYPAVSNVNPSGFDPNGNGWSLANSGDVVRLFNSSSTLHDMVEFVDGGDWPTSPDGNGPSLELINPVLDNSLATSWDPSVANNGTPGAKNSVYSTNVQPTCKDGQRSPALPTNSDKVTIAVVAYDNEGLARVELFVNLGSGYVAQSMVDNGTNGDAVAGDSLYTAVIPAQAAGKLVKYYAVATDNIGQQDFWPNNAPTDYHAYTVDYQPPKLLITEVLAVNNSVNSDAFGDFDDWFEIHNADSKSINLDGMYVSNSLNTPKKFKLPSVTLAPNEYMIIWADDESNQGNLHANFKLSSQGEEIGIFETVDHGNVLIHGWKFGLMSANVSMGFMPENGTAPEYLKSPTPNAANQTSPLFSPVCINEFQSTSDFGGPDDWIEIYNRSSQNFDISGCFLSDSRSDMAKWTFPQGKILKPGEYLVIYEDVLGFSLTSEGNDVIMLTAADSSTGLDFYDFGPQQPDKSEGRFPDGANTWKIFVEPTRGTSNSSGSDVETNPTATPGKFELQQNYPNPFNPTTTITFSLPARQKATVKIFNTLGQNIYTLVDDILAAGDHSFVWQAQNVPSGVYFYQLDTDDFTAVRKMILAR
ncbi:MAG: T9SS C-terminal target domain-containing protein [Calditrichaeota bacterium]|nr:MAG: T9SS C-terminal target domain-containing protein [Calditrichota bacterium]